MNGIVISAPAAYDGLTPAQRCYAYITKLVNERGSFSRMQREWVQQAHDKGLIDASQHGFVRQQEAA
jgi:hypothetical protein